MRFLSRSECAQWAERHQAGFALDERYPEKPLKDRSLTRFEIPTDSGKRVALCRFLWRTAAGGNDGDRLLWIADWSIWPSGEHFPLWTRFRQTLGERRSLEEAPGCLCTVEDDDDGLSVLVISCLFLWDCWLLNQTGTAIFISHDEIGHISEPFATPPPDTAAELGRLGVLRT